MYIDIKHMKSKGFSNSKIANMLGISRPTVIKYANMTPEEFRLEMEKRTQRTKKAEKYDQEIVTWLKQYPQMTAAQLYDWLEEKYEKLDFNESSMRNYVRYIREKYDIPKEFHTRQYEAAEDPPMGQQMQVDFGEKKVIDSDRREVTLYATCFVLSNSRYKYCEWQSAPLTTRDVIRIHENAFEYFGGYPEEVVYDQDHLILVSENHGDLIYTGEFASYLQKRKFKVRMCRRADPESKGKVEKTVDFVKDNFASNRTFYSIDRWNEDCLKWLKRRGNGKIHGTTRKIPAEVFLEEKKYLKPVLEKIISKTSSLSITYQVRKDNTVPIQGNRYTVPRGTYKGSDTYVGIQKIGNTNIIIYDINTHNEIARHEVPSTKGNLVSNNNHRRDKTKKINDLIEDMIKKFKDVDNAAIFLSAIHVDKPRYMRDQLVLIESVLKKVDENVADRALKYCVANKLYSAVDFRDAATHYSRNVDTGDLVVDTNPIKGLTESATKALAAKAKIRDINEYTEIFNGN